MNLKTAIQYTKQYRILREAAQRVIDNWDEGDLAAAVRELSLVLDGTKERE